MDNNKGRLVSGKKARKWSLAYARRHAKANNIKSEEEIISIARHFACGVAAARSFYEGYDRDEVVCIEDKIGELSNG